MGVEENEEYSNRRYHKAKYTQTMAEARESPSQHESVTERDEPLMQTTDWSMLLLRAKLDRMDALLTSSTNAAINLIDKLRYVQMAVNFSHQQSNANRDFCLQQKAVIEILEKKIKKMDLKIKELELEIISRELQNEHGDLLQVEDCFAELITEAQRCRFSIRKSVYFYTGPYGSDSFKLQIFYRLVSSHLGLCLQFGVYVKAGPRDQCPFSKKMSIRIYGIENGKVKGSIGVKFTPPVALYPQLYPDGTDPFWIEQFLYLSEIQQVIKDNSFVLSVKVES